jgi:hypothetical protein
MLERQMIDPLAVPVDVAFYGARSRFLSGFSFG